MKEEEKELSQNWFYPEDEELVKKKFKAHKLSQQYNQTFEDEIEKRKEILKELLGSIGENCGAVGPIWFHYGCHTHVGNNVYFNTHFTVQDDNEVFIGDDCRFGPNITIVTPLHPLDANQRRSKVEADGVKRFYCLAKPVRIGHDCWFGANVTICPGVTIGDNCVIGAGSVVTKDIPSNSLAVGVPCKVIRKIDEKDIVDLPNLGNETR